jgi:release factor glutamine methyltransferase
VSASIADSIESAAARLHAAGVPSPRADAELLVAHVLGLGRGSLIARSLTGGRIDEDDLAALAALLVRRESREPLQHITGEAYFRGLRLSVGPGVFVPRPETEIVVQHAIDALMAVASASPVAVDLGTGSGAIALAMATEVPHASVIAVEVSPSAFTWAEQNRRAVGADNLRIVLADLADALPELDGRVDVVISNPPYIPIGAIPRDPEVRRFDPELALYGGIDGLDLVRSVDATAWRLLRPGGMLVIEHGEVQAAAIGALLAASGWRAIAHHRDLTGRDRATSATR